jgi:hypothetical protein
MFVFLLFSFQSPPPSLPVINGLQSLYQSNNLSGFSYFFAYLPLAAPLLFSLSHFHCSLFIGQELGRFSTTTLVFRSQPPLGLLPISVKLSLPAVLCKTVAIPSALLLQCLSAPPFPLNLFTCRPHLARCTTMPAYHTTNQDAGSFRSLL